MRLRVTFRIDTYLQTVQVSLKMLEINICYKLQISYTETVIKMITIQIDGKYLSAIIVDEFFLMNELGMNIFSSFMLFDMLNFQIMAICMQDW